MGTLRFPLTQVLEALVKFETTPKLSKLGAAMLAALIVLAQPFAATQPVCQGLAQSGLGPSWCAVTSLPFMLVYFFKGMLAEFEWVGPLLPGAVAGEFEGKATQNEWAGPLFHVSGETDGSMWCPSGLRSATLAFRCLQVWP